MWEEDIQKQLSQNGTLLLNDSQSIYALALLRLDHPEKVAQQYTGAGMTACFFSVINVVCDTQGQVISNKDQNRFYQIVPSRNTSKK